MNIYLKKRKRILKKILVGFSLFALGTISLYLCSFILRLYLPASWLTQPALSILIVTVIFLIAYKPLDLAFSHLFRNFLFKKKSTRQMTLMNLAEELPLILDLQELGNLIVNTFGDVLQLKSAVLLVQNRVRNDFEIVSAYGWNITDARRVRISQNSPLTELIRTAGAQVLVRDRVIRVLTWQEANCLSCEFDKLHAAWLVPLFVREELMGAIGFSVDNQSCIFDESDFQIFREFAAKAAVCVRNALSVLELKIANEELQDVQSQLLQNTKLVAIEQLATGIAHEIHNPLTIISGKAQVLLLQKDRKVIDERVEEVLKTIVKQTKRAADITRKLLMFSQRSGTPKELLSLEHVWDDTLALVSYQTSLEGIQIIKSVGPGIPLFYANVHELREVFLNLILNAVQSVGSQGEIRIEMNYQAGEQIIEIRVADSGSGIPPEHIGKLFDPFFTTRHDSVGLGLFVTKQIVHGYGGSIRVESQPGQGSIFLIRFPYVESFESVSSRRDASYSLFPSGGGRDFTTPQGVPSVREAKSPTGDGSS
ncbi:MAG: ATP-binding protein [Candidatus Omnitrophica bacterium]|nr:ATP-binding protein [Candidatus Omnitrophota bacterium]